jgi:DNA-binding MarR family transcriptional regulator
VPPLDFVADRTASAAAFPLNAPDAAEDPRLTSEELAVWLPLLRLADLLPQALDRFLREHTGIGHSYHQVLALLSAAPDQRLRMSELAAGTRTSKSRLSHAVACLEDRGLVSRCSDTTDGRGRIARLTPVGRRFLDQTAPFTPPPPADWPSTSSTPTNSSSCTPSPPSCWTARRQPCCPRVR